MKRAISVSIVLMLLLGVLTLPVLAETSPQVDQFSYSSKAFSFSGSGSQAGELLAILIADSEGRVYVVDQIRSDATGGFSGSFPAAAEAGGLVTLTVSGVSGTAQKELRIASQGSTDEGAGSSGVVPGSIRFQDVPQTHWAYPYVQMLCERKIVQGVSETSFAPEAACTRAMFATMLARLGGESLEGFGTGTVFPDVVKGDIYAPYIEWCASKGIVMGFEDGTFGGGKLITREQVVWMLERYAGKEAIREAGIYEPLPSGEISRPTEAVTRAELAKMLSITISYLEKTEK